MSGHSSPNFIGFNLNATLASGGCECYPESLLFSSVVDSVSALVGVGFGATGTISMSAYDIDGGLVDQATVNNDGSGVVQLLAVGGPGIRTVTVDAAIASYAFILDDLCFNFDQTTSTEETTWGTIKQLYR